MQVIGRKGRSFRYWWYGGTIRIDRVPNELGLLHVFPALGLDFQSGEVYFQFVFVAVIVDFRTANDSPKEFSIII